MILKQLITAAASLAIASAAVAGAPPPYSYGEPWWEEYQPDDSTSLLLHFGPAQASSVKAAAKSVAEAREARSLDEDPLTEVAAAGGGNKKNAGVMGAEGLARRTFAAPDAKAPAGKVLDYAHALAYPIPAGAAIVSDGRFGDAIEFTGANGGPGLVVRPEATRDKNHSMECWFKVDKLPERDACLLAIGKDTGRVVLHPDGRLELLRDLPHGHIDPQLSPDARAAIEQRDPTVRATKPIKPGEWNHVYVSTVNVVMQGPSPTQPTLKINGDDVASYLTEPGNGYSFMHTPPNSSLTIGNNAAGNEPFVGVIDEVRVCSSPRQLYTRDTLEWRDANATRPLQWGKPYFRRDGVVFHAPLDHDAAYLRSSSPGAGVTLPPTVKPASLETPGVRGNAWILDAEVGVARLDLAGMSALEGTIECWVRPLNWDNFTRYWSHSPPNNIQLSLLRLYGKDKRDGQVKLFLNATLPRATDAERERIALDPGHWTHLAIAWTAEDPQRAHVFAYGKWFQRVWRADPATLENIEPVYAELGINDNVTVRRGQKPAIAVDEVVGYSYALSSEEKIQAYKRWSQTLEPLRPFESAVTYKASIGTLELSILPKLDSAAAPQKITATLTNNSDTPMSSPVTVDVNDNGKAVTLVLRNRQPLPAGAYRIKIAIEGPSGNKLLEDTLAWNFEPEPWRGNQLGVLDQPPTPWTPIQVNGLTLTTRMTRYTLQPGGLPASILADGQEMLHAPAVMLEGGEPMVGGPVKFERQTPVEAVWTSQWSGKSIDINVRCVLEYDGLIRVELQSLPKAQTVQTITLSVPMKAERATRWFYNEAGATGVRTGVTPADQGVFLSSRRPAFWAEQARARREKRAEPALESWSQWAFLTQIDLNDRDRGIYWFADNAAGWSQSKTVDAQAVSRRGEAVELALRLIAEPGPYASGTPIVFGLLPHPARPMPERYRTFDRVSPAVDSIGSSVFDAFRPWPRDPRGEDGSMKLYPAADPEKPGDVAASWALAEKCIPAMKLAKPTGARTMYLSNYWFSCRAGTYDHWEWRTGPMKQITHTRSFTEYSAWEVNEWIGRGFWDAIYLDECYGAPSNNTENGQAVLLPDGTVQPGVPIFEFREMIKRWRGIFIQHHKEPILLAHHTGSFLYPGLVFFDAFLDGENRPIVSANSGDFIAQVPAHRIEALQNGGLWGVSSFYMPCIWELGFANKQSCPHKVWAWRMARAANAVLAQTETGVTYPGQGEEVYRRYWQDLLQWGAGDAKAVTFVPAWRSAPHVRTAESENLRVAYYRKPGGVLLIVSNLDTKPCKVELNLDTASLGLPPTIAAQSLDSTYTPPAGEDLTQERPSASPVGLQTGNRDRPVAGEELPLDAPDEAAKKIATPEVNGSRISITVRARDYRVIAVSPAP